MAAAARWMGLAALAALGGCATAPTIQRWAEVTGLPPSSPPELLVASAPAQAPDALTIKALPDHAAAAYVAALASRDPSVKALRGDIARPIKAPPAGVTDGTVVERVILVTVERPTIRPGDRLLMTRVVLRPADPNVTFTDYQLAATERATISVGTATITDSYGGSAGVGPGDAAAGGVLANASVSATRAQGASRAITEEAIFAVSAAPRRIEIFKTGAPDRDLLGGTLIKVGLRYGALVDTPLYYVADVGIADAQTGALLEPKQVSVALAPLAVHAPRDLWVCARMDYEDREVSDPKSQDEGRQTARIVTAALPEAAYQVVPYQDLQQPLWRIRDTGGSTVAFADGLTVRELAFDDYDTAAGVLAWLKLKHPGAIRNGRLGVDLGALLEPIDAWDRLRLEPLSVSLGAPGPAPDCSKPPAP